MVDIRKFFNEGGGVVFSRSKPNKNAVSPLLFPGLDKTEIQNTGWIWTESDAHIDMSPVILCVGDRPVRTRPPAERTGRTER